MAHILILGGGAAGLAAALAAAQTDPTARVTVLERSPRPGKKLLATGNGRCNLDNEGITPESYSSADRAALDALLRTVNAADPLGWFRALGLYTRTDETGRVYPYSNQAADVLALLQGTIRAFSQTLVMITHNPEIAKKAQQIIRIEDGCILKGL